MGVCISKEQTDDWMVDELDSNSFAAFRGCEGNGHRGVFRTTAERVVSLDDS